MAQFTSIFEQPSPFWVLVLVCLAILVGAAGLATRWVISAFGRLFVAADQALFAFAARLVSGLLFLLATLVVFDRAGGMSGLIFVVALAAVTAVHHFLVHMLQEQKNTQLSLFDTTPRA